MLSRRFTDKAVRMAAAVLATLAVAGCATPGLLDGVIEPRPGPAGADGMTPGAREVPPNVLTMFEQATAALAGGDFVDAELRFQEFVLQYPDYPGAWVNLAIIRAQDGNDAGAREALDAALALDPTHPAALNQMGMLLRRNGDFLAAEAAYLKAVTVSPGYALAHYNLGVLNDLYLQRLETALQHFETYHTLVGEDQQVAKWIIDLKRRVEAAQRTANVAE
ncbi:MAG: tetratricopeptide repeat protein [Woeseiaceae bacterium]